jgi:hypothetical protein
VSKRPKGFRKILELNLNPRHPINKHLLYRIFLFYHGNQEMIRKNE